MVLIFEETTIFFHPPAKLRVRGLSSRQFLLVNGNVILNPFVLRFICWKHSDIHGHSRHTGKILTISMSNLPSENDQIPGFHENWSILLFNRRKIMLRYINRNTTLIEFIAVALFNWPCCCPVFQEFVHARYTMESTHF